MKISTNTPLITVIIPCYNGAAFVGETIQSVLTQTYTKLQIIIVDDGSTDNSASVVKSFSDHRIQYIYQENHGLSAARNTGLRHGKGDYISFLDADDLLLPTKIEHQVHFLEQHLEFGLVAQGFIRTDERGKHLYASKQDARVIELKDLIVRSQFPVHTTLIRKEWIDKVGFFDTNLSAAEDWNYYCRLGIEGCKMFKQNTAECTYRLLDNAMTTNAPRQTEMLLQVVEKTFAHPKLPSTLLYLHESAKFQIILMGACRCLALNYFQAGIQYLKKAIILNPKKVSAFRYEYLVETVAFFIKHMQVTDTERKAEKIVENGAKELPFLKKIRQKIGFHIGLTKTPKKFRYFFVQLINAPISTLLISIEIVAFKIKFRKQ